MKAKAKAWRTNAQNSLRILHVDDEPAVSSALKRSLRKQPYEITSVQNGYAAILLARETKYDLVILDVAMPGMDGFSLLETLRNLDPTVKAISLTGLSNNQVVFEAIKAGFDGYLEKPYDPNGLGQEIDNVLQHNRESR